MLYQTESTQGIRIGKTLIQSLWTGLFWFGAKRRRRQTK